MNELPMLISFSGGRTSAFMTKFLLEHPQFENREKVIVFANTGKEYYEELPNGERKHHTLDFVNECDKRWGLGIVWVEAKVNPEKGVGTSFKIVSYETASRKGEPFKDVITKYGIPNKQFPHCTRELKQIPIKKYMQSLGYKDWITAVGIRADEPHRINRGKDTNFKNPFFPLNDLIQIDEQFIREWWDKQDFDLKIKDYESNCDLCWKKSRRKRMTLIAENPNIWKWWNNMETKHGENSYIFDQREGISIEKLVETASLPFQKAIDKHEKRKIQIPLFDPQMDMEWDCFCKST